MLLPAPLRFLWLAINLFLGALPSLLFFVWVERNCALPQVPISLGWPWISFHDSPLALQIAWDAGLFLAFGAAHSALAQPRAHVWLERVLPVQAVRSAYLAVTGLSLLGLMGCWQPTGRVVWLAPLPLAALNVLSLAIYWACMAVCAWLVSRFDAMEFTGLAQLYRRRDQLKRSSGMSELIRSGIYARVRHPIYSFTLAAFLLTPFLSLDRLVVTLAAALYLAFAIPVEERKLEKLFGAAYARYRKEVPAVLPRLIPRS